MPKKGPVNEVIRASVEYIEENTKEHIVEIQVISRSGVVAKIKMEDLDGSFPLREASLWTLK